MDEAQALELAARILTEARAAGAESAEASVSIAARMHVEALAETIARLENSRSCSMLLRVFKNGRKATLNNEMHRFRIRNGRVIEWVGAEDTGKVAALWK